MEQESPLSPITHLDLCLEFADTVDWRTSDHSKDTLSTYGDLVSWSVKKGVIAESEGDLLVKSAETRRNAGDDVLSEARVLREAVYRIFTAVAHGRRAEAADIGTLNGYLARALSKREVQVVDGGYQWGWCGSESLDKMLYPVAQSAADLLTSAKLAKVKECANEEEGCGSLFIDGSKSNSRRWCSMSSCGNRAKFRTYYDRHVRPQA